MPSDDQQLFEDEPKVPVALASVQIRRLHGKFTYDVDLTAVGDTSIGAPEGGLFAVNEDRLTLIYGNNGSGKTSLLRLLFHALSSAPNRGHRKAVFDVRFERLDMRLTNGFEISYHRPEGEIEGRYTAQVERPGADVIRFSYHPDDPARYEPDDAEALLALRDQHERPGGQVIFEEPEEQFLSTLAELRLDPVFLGDSRAITADALDRSPVSARREALRRRNRLMRDEEESIEVRRVIDVDDALERVRQYLSQLAFAGTQAGSQRVDLVYVTVAAAISQHAPGGGADDDELPNLKERVASLSERAGRYYRYGLLPEFPGEQLATRLDEAPPESAALLKQVLDPYLEGLDERMNALDPGLKAVTTFVEALNAFLENKRLDVVFQRGAATIGILDEETNDVLPASALSSGEKQIVLLFSDIVALQDETGLFIIDEPELSLNPEWQRKLMPQLLEVTAPSRMQLIAATHSIEIMARYRDRIRRLGE